MNTAGLPIWASPQERLELLVHGNQAVNQATKLHSFLLQRLGADSANLLAAPKSTKRGLVWSDRLGATETIPLHQLSDADRMTAEQNLRTLLAPVEQLQGDPEYGTLVSAALAVEDPSAIRVAGQRPIIAGWGSVPANVVSADDMRRHHELTLGPYLNYTDPPVPRFDNRSIAAVAPQRATSPHYSRAALIATLIVAAVLVLLLLPGVLQRGNEASSTVVLPPSRNSVEVDRALENEIAFRRKQLEGNVCLPEQGNLPTVLPESLSGPALPKGPSGSVRPAPSQPQDVSLPVEPGKTPVPSESVPSDAERPSSLTQLLQDATVLVSTANGHGSGFFISPDLVISNRHVVENSSGTIHIGNRKLGRMLPVELVAMTPNSNLGQPDYALLRLTEGKSSSFLSLAGDAPAQLQNVIASGYPQVVVSTDTAFQRLKKLHDASSIPDVALTNGAVVVIQNRETPTPIILHRASISPGSSGGPLVDECGRVVGVNTFIRPTRDQDGSDRMHYSLGAASAARFATQNGASTTVVRGRCVVSIASTEPPPGKQQQKEPAGENPTPPPGTDKWPLAPK